MSKLIFGFDRFKEDGDPLPNCEDYIFKGKKICNCGNVFLGMIQNVNQEYLKKSKREWEFLEVDTLPIDKIKSNYVYHIDVNCFAWSLGYNRWPETFEDVSVFDSISSKVIKDAQNGKCKILLNYGYEGLSAFHRDTILYKPLLERVHFLLDKYKIAHKDFIYMDSNHRLDKLSMDTDINIIQYEYCAFDQWRYTTVNFDMMYHGNSISSNNMRKWVRTKNKLRSKYYLSFNRLPKKHRVDLIVSLDKNNLLDKGYVSFANNISDWNWRDMVTELERESLEKKMPLVIDRKDLSDAKYSYEKFEVKYYLDSYFQIATGNNFTDFNDQLIFSEKIWKPITNLQPFIYLDDTDALKKLQEYGFKTFHPFIDESYDNVIDTEERFVMIENEINKLCNKSIEEIDEWYWSIEETLKHNYYLFYNTFIPNLRTKMVDSIGRVVNA